MTRQYRNRDPVRDLLEQNAMHTSTTKSGKIDARLKSCVVRKLR